MPRLPLVSALLLVLAQLLCVPVSSQAQTHPSSVWTARGVTANRSADGFEPWEHIDLLSGSVVLSFTDFEMPGDNGVTLRFERHFNSKGNRAWWFGLADIPMRVFNINPQFPFEEHQLPLLYMSDGATHRARFQVTAQQYRTREQMHFRRAVVNGQLELRVNMPNGLVGYYAVLPYADQNSGYLVRIENAYGTVAELDWVDGYTIGPGYPGLAEIRQFVSDGSGGVATRTLGFNYGSLSPYPVEAELFVGTNVVTRQYSWSGGNLDRYDSHADPPWTFTYSGQLDNYTLTVTTPNGGAIDYEIENVLVDVDGNQQIFTERLKYRKVWERSDAGVRSAGGTWDYTQIDGVRGPDQRRMVHRFATGSDDQAPLEETTIYPPNSTQFAEREIRTYTQDAAGERLLLTARIITRDGSIYRTSYDYAPGSLARQFALPTTVTEVGREGSANAVTRVTSRGYDDRWSGAFSQPYRAPQVSSETVQVTSPGGAVNTVSHGYQYDAAGFKTSETIAGVTRTFTPTTDGRGNVRTEQRLGDGVVTYTHAFGGVQRVATPAYAIDRAIDTVLGLPLWEERDGHRTSYAYDGLGRRTLVSPPLGEPTQTTFDSDRITELRGDDSAPNNDFRRLTYGVNGFGRVVSVLDAKNIVQYRTLNAYGEDTFRSLPHVCTGAGAGCLDSTGGGVSIDRDVLGRVTLETGPAARPGGNATTRRYDYAGGDLVTTDEESHQTTEVREAFGSPGDYRIGKLVDATGQTFSYTYTVLGGLLKVVGPGNTTIREFTYDPVYPGLVASEVVPESGLTTYQNANGRRSQRTTNDNKVFDYHYDANGRLFEVVSLSDPTQTRRFEYDARDNRTRARNGDVDSSFEFDANNRLTRRVDTITGFGPADAIFQYNDFDNLRQIRYPSGSLVDYQWDRAGRLFTVSHDGAVLATVESYHASGGPERIRFANGTLEVIGYDGNHRVSSVQSGRESPQRVDMNLAYEYSDAGNAQKITNLHDQSLTREFVYDTLNRLERSKRAGFPDLVYGYDARGNRTSVGPATYTYDVANRLTGISLPAETLLYDGRGNMRQDGRGTYDFTVVDTMRRSVVGGVTVDYTYDADGLRKSKTTGGVQSLFFHGPIGQILTEGYHPLSVPGAVGWLRDYVYAGSRLLATIRPAPPTRITFEVLCAGAAAPATTCTVPEAIGTVVVRATVTTDDNQPTRKTFAMPFRTVPGTAGSPLDFTAASGTVTVAAGTPSGTSWDLPIVIAGDSVDDPDPAETFSVELTDGAGGALPPWVTRNAASVSIAIADDDAAVPIFLALTPATQRVSEAAGSAMVGVMVTTANLQATARDIVVTYATVNGSAVAGSDFVAAGGPVLIPTGTANGAVLAMPIQLVNDASPEALESFTLTVSTAASDTTITVPSLTVEIADDDAPVGIRLTWVDAAGTPVTTQQVLEESGSVPLRVRVTTDDAQPTKRAVAATAVTSNGTATAGQDYTATSIAYTIPQGTAHGAVIPWTVPLTDDVATESLETFTTTLATTTSDVTIPAPTHTTQINDDDGIITLAFAPASQSVSEAAGSAPLRLRVTTADGLPTRRPVSTTTVTANGSAVAGQDYTALTFPYVIPVGTASGSDVVGAVAILNDVFNEPSESFTATVSSTTHAVSIVAGTLTTTITDDDVAISVGFTTTAQTVWENDGSAPLAMRITTANGQPTSRAVTIRYQTVNGTALTPGDYAALNATYTFAAGTASGTVVPGAATLANDTVVEGNETFGVTLTAETAGVTVSAPSHVVTVRDDDQIYIRFSAPSSSVAETSASAPVSIVVTTDRGTPTSRAVTLTYATVGGSATQGLDFTGVTGSFVIAAGTPSGTPFGAAVPILDDAMWENAETFTMQLSAPGAATDPPHTFTIVNNDTAAYYAQVDLTPSAVAVWEYAGALWISAKVTTYNGAPTTAPIVITARTVHEWGGPNPATPNVDYQALGQAGAAPATFTIAAGTPSGTIVSTPLLIGNDTVDEPNEWFQFRISMTTAASMVPLQGDWIYDDDPGPFGMAAPARTDGAAADASEPAPAVPAPPTISRPARRRDFGNWTVQPPQTAPPQPLSWTAGAKQ